MIFRPKSPGGHVQDYPSRPEDSFTTPFQAMGCDGYKVKVWPLETWVNPTW